MFNSLGRNEDSLISHTVKQNKAIKAHDLEYDEELNHPGTVRKAPRDRDTMGGGLGGGGSNMQSKVSLHSKRMAKLENSIASPLRKGKNLAERGSPS